MFFRSFMAVFGLLSSKALCSPLPSVPNTHSLASDLATRSYIDKFKDVINQNQTKAEVHALIRRTLATQPIDCAYDYEDATGNTIKLADIITTETVNSLIQILQANALSLDNYYFNAFSEDNAHVQEGLDFYKGRFQAMESLLDPKDTSYVLSFTCDFTTTNCMGNSGDGSDGAAAHLIDADDGESGVVNVCTNFITLNGGAEIGCDPDKQLPLVAYAGRATVFIHEYFHSFIVGRGQDADLANVLSPSDCYSLARGTRPQPGMNMNWPADYAVLVPQCWAYLALGSYWGTTCGYDPTYEVTPVSR